MTTTQAFWHFFSVDQNSTMCCKIVLLLEVYIRLRRVIMSFNVELVICFFMKLTITFRMAHNKLVKQVILVFYSMHFYLCAFFIYIKTLHSLLYGTRSIFKIFFLKKYWFCGKTCLYSLMCTIFVLKLLLMGFSHPANTQCRFNAGLPSATPAHH